MAQFIAFDPKVEVSGASMLSVISAMGEKVKPLLAAFGLDDIQPDQWYPLQPYLDFYRVLSEARYTGMINLMKIGMQVPEIAPFPPTITDIHTAFDSLDTAYHMNHRGGDFGHYFVTPVSVRHITVVAHNPFPCDLDYGIVQGLARRFKPANANLIVYHDALEGCRKKDSDRCTYHVTW